MDEDKYLGFQVVGFLGFMVWGLVGVGDSVWRRKTTNL
jgi:hypothetical protein